jgi:hypothetical protein
LSEGGTKGIRDLLHYASVKTITRPMSYGSNVILMLSLLSLFCAVAVNLVQPNKEAGSTSSRVGQGTAATNISASASSNNSTAPRFAAAYALVGILALNQLAGSLFPDGRTKAAARVFLTIATILMTCLMGVAWVGAKGAWRRLLRGRDDDDSVVSGGSAGGEENSEELLQLLQPTSRPVVPATDAVQRSGGDATGSGIGDIAMRGRQGLQGIGGGWVGNGHRERADLLGVAAAAADDDDDDDDLAGGQISQTQSSTENGGFKQYMQGMGRRTEGRGNSTGSGSGNMATLAGCFQSAEFWLLFLVFATGVGSGLAFSNNLPELVAALAPAAAAGEGGSGSSSSGGGGTAAAAGAVALVSLFSVGSCFGR